ncbi:MAG: hypothetical protein ABI672_04990 [Vicinamibacteria bacterium]
MSNTSPIARADMDARSAFEKGNRNGGELVATRGQWARQSRPSPQGLIVAQGDAWFDCPGGDLLSAIEDLGYEVEGNAHSGLTLQDLSFNGRRLGDLHRLLNRLKSEGRTPKAIILSAGADDFAGAEFAQLINHVASGLTTLDHALLEGLVQGRLKVALAHWIGSVDAVARGTFGLPIRILIHGYDYPVPDGRGQFVGPTALGGPWLRSGFWLKGHTNLQRNRGVIRELINRFNDMQLALVDELELPNLVHVDLRTTLSSMLYENDWDNETQPTEAGFRALARKIAAMIQEKTMR